MTVNLTSQLTGLVNTTLRTTTGKPFLVTGVAPANVSVVVGPAQQKHTIRIANLQTAVDYALKNGKNALSGPADYRNLIANDRPAYAWAILHHLGYV